MPARVPKSFKPKTPVKKSKFKSLYRCTDGPLKNHWLFLSPARPSTLDLCIGGQVGRYKLDNHGLVWESKS